MFEDNFVCYNPQAKDIELFPKDKLDKIKGEINIKELKKNRINFDLIIFNPPYLPQDKGISDKSLYGGKKGFETLAKFLNNVKDYLKMDARCVILFSSITGKKRIGDILKKNNLKFLELAKEHIFFEDIYVYYVSK